MLELPNLNHSAVRDLAWSLFSPNLINDYTPLVSDRNITSMVIQLTPARIAWMQELDSNPTPLLTHLEKRKSTRLGIYFEYLWQFFLQQDKQYQLIAANLPIHDNGKTLGEFDLIIKDTFNDEVIHLELAVKFFLQTSMEPLNTDSELNNWLGPNCKDRLDIKLHRLLNHQILLNQTESAAQLLSSKDIHITQRKIALKGYLFYPFTTADQSENCQYLSTDHHRGKWLSISAFEKLAANTKLTTETNRWQVLQRPRWLSQFSQTTLEQNDKKNEPMSDTMLISYAKDFFQQQALPVMICSLKINNSRAIETNRFFITPDDWPYIPS